MVAYPCNSNYLGSRDRRIVVQGQSRKKVSKAHFKKTSRERWLTLVMPATQEKQVRRIAVLGQPRIKHRTLSEKQT
jgi:hypothetical protein